MGKMRFFSLMAMTALFWAMGCSTAIRPTRPDAPLTAGEPVAGLTFDGNRIDIREPGTPVSNTRAWQREVANYTATQLNTLLATDETSPAVRTVVTFDLASPAPIQFDAWKEMTIELTTVLPSGQRVRSAPVTSHIDTLFEHLTLQGLVVTGSALDVVATLSALLYSFGGVFPETRPYVETACYVFIGALIGGLLLNVGQTVGNFLVAQAEEVRWSNLYAEALRRHADDIRAALGRNGPPTSGSPRKRRAEDAPLSGTPAAPPSAPPSARPPPEPPAPPPPLDPADQVDRALQERGGETPQLRF